MNIDDTKIAEAIDRIARTGDGLALYLYLQKTLCGTLVNPTGDALLADHGRRTFASGLMAQMRQGVQESHGGNDPASQPFVFTNREPARAGGRVSARDFAKLAEPDYGRTERNPGTE